MQQDTTSLIERLASAILSGDMKPGDRLPPQRSFAFEHGIANSTAGRVYAVLLQRGLVVGEVGRGTFVARRSELPAPAADVQDGRVDLEYNFPSAPGQSTLIAPILAELQAPAVLDACLRPVSASQLARAERIAARTLRVGDWHPPATQIVFTGNGRQAIAGAIATVVPSGGRLAVEAVTYPQVKAIAARLGITLVPITIDADGLNIDALVRAHRQTPFGALYLQPTLHNPCCHTMNQDQRQALARIAATLDIVLIEDVVHGFLADERPLAALAPERTILIDSLSKRIAPGVAVGSLVVPSALHARATASVRSGAWRVSSFALEFGMRLLDAGVAETLARLKRDDAAKRQVILTACLGHVALRRDLRAYHAQLLLPEGWRSETFVSAAARHGISLTPSSAFCVAPGHAPAEVRLALSAPSYDELRSALQTLARLLDTAPHDHDMTE
jgi:DNA-binding transcriptional MocR family regulator